MCLCGYLCVCVCVCVCVRVCVRVSLRMTVSNKSRYNQKHNFYLIIFKKRGTCRIYQFGKLRDTQIPKKGSMGLEGLPIPVLQEDKRY